MANADAIYATHSRNRDKRYFVGFGEALDLARDTGVRLQISHINPKYGRPEHAMRNTLQMIEWTRAEGLDVAMDMMPTNWNHTAATSMLPAWAFGLSDRRVARPDRVEGRAAASCATIRCLCGNSLSRSAGTASGCWRPRRIEIWWAARSPDLTEARNTNSGWDTVFDLLLEEGARLKGLMLTSEAFAEGDNRMVLEHPLCAVESDTMALATDGPLGGRMMGLLGFNWVPRFLAHYVRDEGVLSLEEGVRRLTGLPADRLGLDNRGYLRIGAAADVVVFDLDGLRDNSTFENPTVYASGIEQVVVNGELVFSKGDRTEAHGGQVLRRQG